MSVLVAGAGSIGSRHLRNLRHFGLTRLAVCDPDPGRLAEAAAEFKAEPYCDLEAALQTKPAAVFVCTPPIHHVAQALQAVRGGSHVFIEKPLSNRLEGVDELAQEAARHERLVQVGYNLRFHPAIRKFKQLVEEDAIGKVLWARAEFGQYLPTWRPKQDYRQSYTARRDLGGGIILDASHEIDYLLWILGLPVELICMAGRVSQLEVDVEDCATILLRFLSAAQADVHVDFVRRTYSRQCTLVGEKGTVTWNWMTGRMELTYPDRTPATLDFFADTNLMYLAEVEHFLMCIQNRTTPIVGLADAKAVLRVALAARTSALEKQWVSLEWSR